MDLEKCRKRKTLHASIGVDAAEIYPSEVDPYMHVLTQTPPSPLSGQAPLEAPSKPARGRFEEASSGLGEKDVYAAFSRNKMLPIFVAAML